MNPILRIAIMPLFLISSAQAHVGEGPLGEQAVKTGVASIADVEKKTAELAISELNKIEKLAKNTPYSTKLHDEVIQRKQVACTYMRVLASAPSVVTGDKQAKQALEYCHDKPKIKLAEAREILESISHRAFLVQRGYSLEPHTGRSSSGRVGGRN